MLNAQCDTDEYPNNMTPKEPQFIIGLVDFASWTLKTLRLLLRPAVTNETFISLSKKITTNSHKFL